MEIGVLLIILLRAGTTDGLDTGNGTGPFLASMKRRRIAEVRRRWRFACGNHGIAEGSAVHAESRTKPGHRDNAKTRSTALNWVASPLVDYAG